MASNIKSRVEDQTELALSRKPVKADVPVEMIRAQQSAAAAFSLACSASGLESTPGISATLKKARQRFRRICFALSVIELLIRFTRNGWRTSWAAL